jgi:hypothetical protein
MVQKSRRARRAPPPPIDVVNLRPPYSMREWCALRRMSISTFKKRRKDGKAPRIVYEGKMPKITEEADRDWLRRLDAGELGTKPRGRPRKRHNTDHEKHP